MDLQALLAATRPQHPSGASASRGWGMGMDAARHDQTIEMAKTLAQLQARMQAMKDEEFAAGHEGRMAGARVQGALAKDDEFNLGSIIGGRAAKRSKEEIDARKQKIIDELETV